MGLSIAANVRECTSWFEIEDSSPWWATLRPANEPIRPDAKRPVLRRGCLNATSSTAAPRPVAHPAVAGLDEEVPFQLATLAQALNESRWMLELEDDFDGDGSPGYAEATWERAARFLIDSAKFALELGFNMPVPKVQNGPEGTLDLFWETSTAKLLLNIPIEVEAQGQYYGYRTDGSETRGSFDISHPQPWLLLWTAEQVRK